MKNVNNEFAEAKPKKKSPAKPKREQTVNAVKFNRLKLLIVIVGRNKAEFYSDLLLSFEANMLLSVLAEGTANQSMLNLLGLANSEKSVIISVINEKREEDALAAIESKFNTIKDGKGVAFTCPVSGVIGRLIYYFLSNDRTVNLN